MKRLLIAIAAAATTMFASAAVLTQAAFEGTLDGGFTGDGGTPKQYKTGVDEQTESEAYPFDSFGKFYCDIDADTNEPLTSPSTSGAVFDMFVQFTPMTETPTVDDDAKIAIYLNSATNLVVVGDKNYEFANVVAAGEWARLTIVPVSDGYKVSVGGVPLSEPVFTAKSTGAASYVTFTGTGKLDNFVARTTDPFGGAPTGWIANIGTDDPEQYFTDYTKALEKALAGATLTFADPTVQMDGSAAHPFEIRSEADLVALQQAVATTPAARAYNYVQTADIALTEAWPGIGIQNGKDLANNDAGAAKNKQFDDGAFTGTYDGGNNTISGFQMVDGLDYCGFFNSVKGATIKNLKISYKDGSFAKDMAAANEACGATFVGVAKASTLQNLTSLEGTVSCTKGFGGIVGYLMAGSTVDSCTNNVNLTSTASNKAGGIAMITQSGTGTATIRNCQNNGTTAGNANQQGGIVGYVGVATAIDGCSDTAGSRPSILHNQGQTVTISGVITAPTNVVAYTTSNNNPIDGLDFATVDANGIATFVKAADLAAGNTYKVMGPKAAYAFTQAGTLALDQSLAAATVTADTSTLVLSDETVDTVTTYTAVAGVASVNNVAYATFDEAVEAIGETGDDFVTLLANVTTDLNAGTTLKVRTNAHELTFNKADDVLVTPTVDSSTGITTYTSVEGMAKCNNTWYATFNEAYSAALSSSGNATMEVKLTSDFTPDISATYDHFYSLKFTDVRDDKTEGLTINLKNAAGTAYMKSSRYFFPENATLNLAADYDCWTNNLISGGTLNIPEGVTVSIGAYLALNKLTSIIGEGRIKPSAAACYYLLFYSDDKLPTSLRETTWKGTLELSGTYTDNFNLNNYGNSDSTIAFNAYTGYVHSVSRIANVGSIEVLGGGLTVNGDYSSGTYTFPNTVKGSGPLTVHVVDAASGTTQKTVKFTGDVSAFAGDLKIVEGSNCRVAFGSEGLAGDGSCIVVCSDAEVSVAAGKTWDSQNGFVVLGTMNVFGTLKHKGGSANDKIYGSATTGKIVYKNAAAITTFGGSYKGEIVIDSIEAGTTLTQVALAFGCEGAKLTLNGVSGNAWCADADYTVKPEVTLAGNVHFQNGSSGKTVTFRKIAAGTGNLSLRDWNGCTGITYGFTTLDADNYTGTVVLYGSKLTFKVGNILKTGAVAGDKVLPLTVESNATVDLSNATLNGETADFELKADGIYVAAPAVPKVAEVVNGEQYDTLAEALADATDGATVKLLADVATERTTISKSLTLDLGGKTLTGRVTIDNGTVTVQNGTIAGRFDTYDSATVTLAATATVSGQAVVWGDGTFGTAGCKTPTLNVYGTITNTGDAAISCNGTDMSGAIINIYGGAVVTSTDEVAVFLPSGNLTVSGGTITGTTGIYAKSGTVTVTGGTITGNGAAAAYVYRGDGATATGDAIVIDNAGYPGGAPAPSISGGTFISVNASAIASYSKSGYPRITKFAAASLKTSSITEAVASSADVFDDYVDIVPVTPGAQTEPVDTAEKAQAIAEKTVIEVPEAVAAKLTSEEQQTAYKALFEAKAVEVKDGDTTKYAVEVALKADVVSEIQTAVDAEADDLAKAAVAAAADATNGGEAAVATKPGLYYVVEAGSEVNGITPASCTLATSTETKLNIPNKGTKGFYKISVSVTPVVVQE